MARKPLTFQQALMASFNPVANGPLGQRASHEAMLRYLPQIQALLLLRQQARVSGRQNVQSARRSGLAAAGGIGQTATMFHQQLADTQAPTSEAAAHLGLTRDAVAGDLAKMQAQQYAGVTSGVSQARRQTQSDQASIVQQLLGAAQQGSLYNTSEYDSLANDAHKSRVAQRQAQATLAAGLLKAGYDTQGRPIPGLFDRLHPGKSLTVNKYGRTPEQWAALTDAQRQQIVRGYDKPGASKKPKAAPGTAGAASQADYSRYQDHYSQAQQLIKYIPHGLSDVEAVQFIQAGIPKTNNSAGVKGVGDQAAAWAAWEMHRYKGVSDYVAGLLHQRGLTVRTLKYPHFTPRPKRRPRPLGISGNGSA